MVSLAEYRIEKAKNDLHDAKLSFEMEMFDTAANRSYYAIFHAARAVLALDGLDFKKHAGVVATFSRDYIKTGVFPPIMAKIIKSAFEMRTESDYEDFYVVSKSEIEQQISEAAFFIAEIEKYLRDKTGRP